jgi:hypothetical protein
MDRASCLARTSEMTRLAWILVSVMLWVVIVILVVKVIQ